MNPASKALVEAPPNDNTTWAARADASGVALTTLNNSNHGRLSEDELVIYPSMCAGKLCVAACQSYFLPQQS
jgi:hypothetical protein